jgi:hypothetical protein
MNTQQSSTLKRNLTRKLQNLPDFSGRDLYAGIHVHNIRWRVAVSYDGLVLTNTSVEGNADALICHFKKVLW